MILSLDTETTGLDLRHGCRPYLVTFCDTKWRNTWWEWGVDPETRQPIVGKDELLEVQDYIDRASTLVLQHAKFDELGLRLLFRDHGLRLRWDWGKVRDTMISAHLLASNQPKDLTTLALIYFDKDIQPVEDRLERAVKGATSWVKDNRPGWWIAKKGDPTMPSLTEKSWKHDGWLPRAVAIAQGLSLDHRWWTVLQDYANSDSASTLGVFLEHIRRIEPMGLMPIYRKRCEFVRVIAETEDYGVTFSDSRREELKEVYLKDSREYGDTCREVASSLGFDLTLPKAGMNNSLRHFLFGWAYWECIGCGRTKNTSWEHPEDSMHCKKCNQAMSLQRKKNLNLPILSRSEKTGAPSADAQVLEDWELSLPRKGKAHRFIVALRKKRKRDTALSYMEAYQRFQLPVEGDIKRLHPSLNIVGTNTLRLSSSNPNEQNVSKKEISGKSVRYLFGPAPGREWWSLDAKNLELRIPAYESGEPSLIELFERPDDPPYYGSQHLLNFSVVYPDIWRKAVRKVGEDKAGPYCKKTYGDTWYQYCKNGDFAVQYGAMERDDVVGTADRAFHREGSHARIKSRFSRLDTLNQVYISRAINSGYVETLPDKTVDPNVGYPLVCTRGRGGRVKQTIPLSYHVQGTACWWMMMAMIRVQKYLDRLNAPKNSPGYYMIMNVHDEVVFDFPYQENLGNLPKIKVIQKLMERGGDDIGVPTPVSIEYHPHNWSDGEVVA